MNFNETTLGEEIKDFLNKKNYIVVNYIHDIYELNSITFYVKTRNNFGFIQYYLDTSKFRIDFEEEEYDSEILTAAYRKHKIKYLLSDV